MVLHQNIHFNRMFMCYYVNSNHILHISYHFIYKNLHTNHIRLNNYFIYDKVKHF